MHFNARILLSTYDSLRDGHVRYEIGPGVGKARPLSAEPSVVRGLDCSGFVQYMIYRGSVHNVRIPGGSFNQESWLRDHGHVELSYADNAWKTDDVLRIGFRERTDDLVRHVWFVINGFTYESTRKGGRNGPTSFHWSTRTAQADSFYVLGNAPGFLMGELSGGAVFA
ncbi:MAG: hypothetical protein WBB25_11825 [Sulfitobacter sp.]